ncbi:unnamed protein product (mitochondrion) [Plasmodiophora brassicae]|uniref:Uncharacterized protein n=1 Tax=Plasmodiophora brassicae TaxID=37360 RepID=A0A3P3YAX8_PLABS|nr:unnamed protein product [Plasmodiophora brassicae]
MRVFQTKRRTGSTCWALVLRQPPGGRIARFAELSKQPSWINVRTLDWRFRDSRFVNAANASPCTAAIWFDDRSLHDGTGHT